MRALTFLIMGIFVFTVSFTEIAKSNTFSNVSNMESVILAEEKPEDEEEPDCE